VKYYNFARHQLSNHEEVNLLQ